MGHSRFFLARFFLGSTSFDRTNQVSSRKATSSAAAKRSDEARLFAFAGASRTAPCWSAICVRPHADMPLTEATFNGRTVTCPHHNWGFDGADGKCVTHIVRNALHPYPLRVEGEEIHVDVGPIKPPRTPA
jgi:toluene monooxygenase system ferredoxin subunit